MNQKSWLLNLSLLKTHPAYRAVFIARFISILSLGLLGVAVPVQIQTITHSSWLVGLSVTLTGGAMFIGLMVGGVLADRYERKKLILLARGTCGVGFVGLCLNAMLPEPSLVAIYVLGLWDGFFASLGVTALLAATPALVGRENLMQAGAITMLTVRLGSVISPMVGGLLLATGNVAWNYGLAAAGTFITTLTLLRLPLLPPPPQPREHPLKSLMAAIRFLFSNPLIGGIALLGGLLTMASAVRVLYPALAGEWQMSASEIGVLYAAIPLGAAWGADQRQPGAERETGADHAGGDAGLVYRDWFLQPDAGVGAGGDVSGDFWLAERGQLAFTVHPDPDPDAGRDARAH